MAVDCKNASPGKGCPRAGRGDAFDLSHLPLQPCVLSPLDRVPRGRALSSGEIKSLFFRAGAVPKKNGILRDLASLPLPWSGSGHGGTGAPIGEPQINAAIPGGSDGKESASNAEDWGSIPGSGRSPGEGKDNPLRYSRLGNPMDRGG